MKNKLLPTVIAILTIFIISCDKRPYNLSENYIYIQNEDRRNDSTEWELVWEDNFDIGKLDTNIWSRIGLFETEK